MQQMASVRLSPYADAPRWLLPAVIAAHGAALVAWIRPPEEPVTPPRPLTVALLAPPPARPLAPRSIPPETPPSPKPKAKPQARPLPRPATAKPEPAVAALPAAPAQEAVPQPAAAAPAPPPVPAADETPLQAARFDAAYLRNPPPPYPPLSRRLGEQGKVLLRVHVSTEGLPMAVEIKSSSGSPRLDEAALETVRKWRFIPARQGDRPLAAWVVVPINFRLEG
jgi:protein TonB